MILLLYADSGTQKATVFNPYAAYAATPQASEPLNGNTSASAPDETNDLLAPAETDMQAATTAYPSSPFANAVPPSASSVALSTASETEETAESGQQESSEVPTDTQVEAESRSQ